MSVELQIRGLEQVEQMFRKAPQKMLTEIQSAINRSILIIERNAKRQAPVNKAPGGGTLRQSIKARMTGKATGEVEVGASYAIYVHEGTRPHIIRPVRRKALANVRTKQMFGRLVMHPGTKANPFLQRAIDDSEQAVNKEFEKIITKVFT